tara:strand:+ start:632 stop:811 length:180 start_codon:yes stop_codon:yes gene_type:complete
MSQPWENPKWENRIHFRKKIKKLAKLAPKAIAMVTVTYLCFLHMTLVKKGQKVYNNYND